MKIYSDQAGLIGVKYIWYAAGEGVGVEVQVLKVGQGKEGARQRSRYSCICYHHLLEVFHRLECVGKAAAKQGVAPQLKHTQVGELIDEGRHVALQIVGWKVQLDDRARRGRRARAVHSVRVGRVTCARLAYTRHAIPPIKAGVSARVVPPCRDLPADRRTCRVQLEAKKGMHFRWQNVGIHAGNGERYHRNESGEGQLCYHPV
mmetsp:Transcript_22741/g.57922  ORF Transcript_22741/g.57922 Transcript_22741/m.57922 type:complete len:204 (+) Transcript_22741:669-1280(+)